VRRPTDWLKSRNGGNVGGLVGPLFTVPPVVEVVAGVGVGTTGDAVGVPVCCPFMEGVLAALGVLPCACGAWVRFGLVAEACTDPLLVPYTGAEPVDAAPPA